MSDQRALFELSLVTEPCLDVETDRRPASQVGDSQTARAIAVTVKDLDRSKDPLQRAQLAGELRDLAEVILASNIRDANLRGLTWRQIGDRLGIPFQTLHRRYGGGDRPLPTDVP